ncbi:MAG: hypothetical protein ACK501_11930 [Planctomycetota bacterium]|jgi:hypothetical protein
MRCWLPTVAFALAIAATPACRGTDGTNAQDPAATTANATTPQLRVRLRGLQPDMPWTEPLALYLQGGDGQARRSLFLMAKVQDGVARFALPDWTSELAATGRIEAEDGNYLPMRWALPKPLDPRRELQADVQVAAVLAGRVVDANGAPVPAARIAVFAEQDGAPTDREIAHVNTCPDGSWRIAVPAASSVYVVAAAMQAAPRRRHPDGEEVADDGQLRSDLLPAGTSTAATVAKTTTVPTFTLATAAQISGIVRWRNGEPFFGATVQVQPRDGTTLTLAHGVVVQRHADGRLSPVVSTRSEPDGRFGLPVLAGAAWDVQLVDLGDDGDHMLLAREPARAVVPGTPVTFELPEPVLLRTRRGDVTEINVTFTGEGWPAPQIDGDGELRVVPNGTGRVRVARDGLRSAWRALGPNDGGSTIDLELLETPVALRLVFPSNSGVAAAQVTWSRADGSTGTTSAGLRNHTLEAMLLPGQYTIEVTPACAPTQEFVMPTRHDVVLDEAPVELPMTVAYGGLFTVTATDSAGNHVAGRATLLGADGEERAVTFRIGYGEELRRGNEGELLPSPKNRSERALPAGDYELRCEFDGHQPVQQRVRLEARKVTDVYLRLP